MRNFLLLTLLVFMSVACSKIPAGHVGVKVYLLGGTKGVDHEVLGVGRYWVGWNEELYKFPTFQQTRTYTQADEDGYGDESFTIQTAEGMVCSMDLGITYTIDGAKISSLFQKYRKGVDELNSVVVKNTLRDAINMVVTNMSVESVYGSGKNEMINKVESIVRETLAPQGINVENVYLVGSVRLPKNVVEALNSKIEATQRAQQRENELREAEAQAKKQIAQAEGDARSKILLAEADAKANGLKLKTLTSELIQYEAVQRWDGKFPSTMMGNALPFIQLK